MTFGGLLPSPKTTMLLRWEKGKLLAFLFFSFAKSCSESDLCCDGCCSIGLMVVVTELHSSIWSGFGHNHDGNSERHQQQSQRLPRGRPYHQNHHQPVKKKRRMDGSNNSNGLGERSEIFQFGGDQNLVLRKERITKPFNFKPSKYTVLYFQIDRENLI